MCAILLCGVWVKNVSYGNVKWKPIVVISLLLSKNITGKSSLVSQSERRISKSCGEIWDLIQIYLEQKLAITNPSYSQEGSSLLKIRTMLGVQTRDCCMGGTDSDSEVRRRTLLCYFRSSSFVYRAISDPHPSWIQIFTLRSWSQIPLVALLP